MQNNQIVHESLVLKFFAVPVLNNFGVFLVMIVEP